MKPPNQLDALTLGLLPGLEVQAESGAAPKAPLSRGDPTSDPEAQDALPWHTNAAEPTRTRMPRRQRTRSLKKAGGLECSFLINLWVFGRTLSDLKLPTALSLSPLSLSLPPSLPHTPAAATGARPRAMPRWALLRVATPSRCAE